jgi:poly-gamma-glutamate synthesis protein (capsule biosynthesis protein)
MKSTRLLLLLFTSLLLGEFHSSIQKITPEIKKRMLKGDSWRKGCPVPLSDLRYIQISHYDFDGVAQTGELIMHKAVANDIVDIFRELYILKYPIYQMGLVSDFSSNDYRSIEADNTSAYNCRNIAGGSKWSKHAYGLAIDINPIENPYHKVDKHSIHAKSLPYEKRTHKALIDSQDRAMLLRQDKATQAFIKRGWNWGGDWKYTKDYQHFEKKLKITPQKEKSDTQKKDILQDLF